MYVQIIKYTSIQKTSGLYQINQVQKIQIAWYTPVV